MLVPDVNVVLAALRRDHPQFAPARRCIDQARSGPRPLGIADIVASSVLRLATTDRVFREPSTTEQVVGFLDALLDPPAVLLAAGATHWATFSRLCREAGVRGNDVPDAHLAALTIAQGAELVTFDRGFARYPGLRWRAPA
ncbi:MAG: PIN domain-containing protein [Patulibacter sp.]